MYDEVSSISLALIVNTSLFVCLRERVCVCVSACLLD